MHRHTAPLPWLDPEDPLPPPEEAWSAGTPAPGLLAASASLEVTRLSQAYREGIFPWYSQGQPVLWWSTDPRMVLQTAHFRRHRSLRQSLQRWQSAPDFERCFDRDFAQVIRACAQQPRRGQQGTWIQPAMIEAYEALHRQGLAHSAEVWQGDRLLAGLYFVSVGRAVFGESMFTRISDGSKMALDWLVGAARTAGVQAIDCQQETRHLASLGAAPIPRDEFLSWVRRARDQAPIDWPAAGRASILQTTARAPDLP